MTDLIAFVSVKRLPNGEIRSSFDLQPRNTIEAQAIMNTLTQAQQRMIDESLKVLRKNKMMP